MYKLHQVLIILKKLIAKSWTKLLTFCQKQLQKFPSPHSAAMNSEFMVAWGGVEGVFMGEEQRHRLVDNDPVLILIH